MKIIEKNSWSIQHRCTGEGNCAYKTHIRRKIR